MRVCVWREGRGGGNGALKMLCKKWVGVCPTPSHPSSHSLCLKCFSFQYNASKINYLLFCCCCCFSLSLSLSLTFFSFFLYSSTQVRWNIWTSGWIYKTNKMGPRTKLGYSKLTYSLVRRNVVYGDDYFCWRSERHDWNQWITRPEILDTIQSNVAVDCVKCSCEV